MAVADIKADVRCLPVRPECSSAVVAHHLLEHLSYREAVYGLAECYRVLEPDGLIEIETPDLERSFDAFLDSGDDRQSAAILTWIFGEERAGQNHRALFPRKLLSKMVTEAGFDRLEFSDPRTHLHRWGLRLTARKDDSNAASKVLSALRPVIAFEVMEEATPEEALELERSLWDPLRRTVENRLTPEAGEAFLLEAMITAPQVISALTERCRRDRLSGAFGGDMALGKLGDAARALQEAEVCTVLRQAFSGLCSSVNQAADGYEHLMSAACAVAKRWLDTPPLYPGRALVNELSAQGIELGPSSDRGFAGDYDIASGNQLVEGRRPTWPRHGLFTRAHLVERARWFRDVGIRCFGRGKHEPARRLFRLAINSKLEGVYSVWNMARLQAVLCHADNAEAFYRAALDFPMPRELEKTLQTELEGYMSDRTARRGPIPVGEGQDRTEDRPAASGSEQ